jgi:glycosyltransferase involved in cell wall biosynthesis
LAPELAGRRTTVLVAHPSVDLYGSDRMMLESIDGFAARGWRVVVTVPGPGPLVAEIEGRGAEAVDCPTPVLQKAFLSPTGVARLLARAIASVVPGVRLLRRLRPDVIYASTLTVPLWMVLGRCLRVPVVCHVHEAESTAPPLLRRLLAAPLLLAHRVIVNSRFSGDVLAQAWPRLRVSSEVVHNGVAGPARPTTARAVLDGPVRLLYIGRLSARKGIEDLIAAMAELHRHEVPATLDVVGDAVAGRDHFEHRLHDRADTVGIGDRIRWHGFDPCVWPHLTRADILVVPSRVDEPFGNVAVEGALAARPVVVARTGGLLEATAGLGAAVTAEPGQPGALAAAIASIVDDWPAMRCAAVADAAVAAARFDPGRYREATADIVAGVHL